MNLKPYPEKQTTFHFQRFEFKYQFPLNRIEGIIPELLKYMDPDAFVQSMPERVYRVSSFYFDSGGYDCYYQKLAGLKNRKKFRVRYYANNLTDETPVFLEIKRKYDAVVVKDRVMVSYHECKNFLYESGSIPAHFTQSEKRAYKEFIWTIRYNGMTAKNLVVYKRKPFISKVDAQFRVTIDYEIMAYPVFDLLASREGVLVNNGMAILEVKFNNILPAWFHGIIQRYELEQKPFSKYCHALEAIHPQLALIDSAAAHTHQAELIL